MLLLIQTGHVMKEHRIRYLSFLGIARDDKFCGYILDCGERSGEKSFKFYGFRMEPNSDRLCLALHAACQARYKRVVDVNVRRQVSSGSSSSSSNMRQISEEVRETTSLQCWPSSLLIIYYQSGQSGVNSDASQSKSSSSLFGRLGSLKKTKKISLAETKSFVVQYLGHQCINRVDGLDTVRPVVQVCHVWGRGSHVSTGCPTQEKLHSPPQTK